MIKIKSDNMINNKTQDKTYVTIFTFEIFLHGLDILTWLMLVCTNQKRFSKCSTENKVQSNY